MKEEAGHSGLEKRTLSRMLGGGSGGGASGGQQRPLLSEVRASRDGGQESA